MSDEHLHEGNEDLYFLTIILLSSYFCVGICSFLQIGRILYYRHSVRSFHFGFLCLSGTWSLIRAVYFLPFDGAPKALALIFYWAPLVLQFAMFSLLLVFYAFLTYKHHRTWEKYGKIVMSWFAIANLANTCITIAVVVNICHRNNCDTNESLDKIHHLFSAGMFALLMILFGYFGWSVSSIKANFGPSHSGQITHFSLILLTFYAYVVFATRVVYNILAAFGVWSVIIYEDNGRVLIDGWGFVLLLVWEVIPTMVVLFLVRHIPQTPSQGVVAVCRYYCCYCWDDDSQAERTPGGHWPNTSSWGDTTPLGSTVTSEASSIGRTGPGLAEDYNGFMTHDKYTLFSDPQRYDTDSDEEQEQADSVSHLPSLHSVESKTSTIHGAAHFTSLGSSSTHSRV